MPKPTRERKHRKRLPTSSATPLSITSNNDAADRKTELLSSLTQNGAPMSSKKRKRLDKYIEGKMRREESLAIMRRLEERKGVEGLESSARLGRRGMTRREEWHRRVRDGDLGREEGEKRDLRPVVDDVEEESEESEEDEEDERDDHEAPEVRHTEHVNGNHTWPEAVTEQAPAPALQAPPPATASAFGSGLKRPLEVDEHGKPIIATRKRRRTGPLTLDLQLADPQEEEDAEWAGFSDDEEVERGVALDGISQASDLESASDEDEDEDSGSSLEDSSSEEDEDDEESDSESSSTSSAPKTATRARNSAFKAWAEQQRNTTLDFTPSTTTQLPEITPAIRQNFTPRAPEADPLPASLLPSTSLASSRKASAIPVTRTPSIQAARLQLPVLAEEQRIMEAVFSHDVVIVSGATGSGKTTQVPQFLFEAGFGLSGVIGITQPRRVAAVSMAQRVAEEMGDAGAKVGYQIRFDSSVGKGTRVKFMTDGVLLREMSADFSLGKYSVVVIDEAHERTVNTDILIALMSRCVSIRRTLSQEQPAVYKPLKLIIMSATLRVSDFQMNTRLFKEPPPIVEAEGRQYGVSIHWTRRTGHDSVEETFKKISRGHRKLPPGGMLVFLTGQADIRALERRLRAVFETTDGSARSATGQDSDMSKEEEDQEDVDTAAHNEVFDEETSDAEDENQDREFEIEGESPEPQVQKIHLLPLYSQLPSKEQLKVFQPPPKGSRQVILATNIAETSLTIPGIRYVIDAGRAKSRSTTSSGVQTFRTEWISKASADQRAGRAGRTGPGHVYRLYSSAIYEGMQQWSQPEIEGADLEGVVLQLKGLGVERVDHFPWPTPPDVRAVVKAERTLRNLGALDARGGITGVGKELGQYPLNPRFAGMIRLGLRYSVLGEVVALVAGLDVPELILPSPNIPSQNNEEGGGGIWTAEDEARESLAETQRKEYAKAMANLSRLDNSKDTLRPQADALRLLAAVLDYSTAVGEGLDPAQWCKDNFLREKGMREVMLLRDQLSNIVKNVHPDAVLDISLASVKGKGKEKQKERERKVAVLKQILAAAFLDHVAIRSDLLPSPPATSSNDPGGEYRKPKRAIDVRYAPLFPATSKGEEEEEDAHVYIHPSSLLARLPPGQVPRYVVYSRLQRSQPSSHMEGGRGKVRMHPLTPVSAEQLSVLARGTGLLDIGKPVGKVEILGGGKKGEERRECEVMVSLVGDPGGGVGWPLGRKRVVQRRRVGRGWEAESWL